MSLRIKKIVAAALVVVGMYAACAQSAVRDLANVADAYLDSSREKREQETAPTHIKEVFALAKKSAEEDFNVNFCGFFAGMSRHDAQALAEYYRLKDGEYSMDAAPGKAVSGLWFSLKGVRRITKGGSTLDELAQSVANRVGDLKKNYATGEYEHKTIDGVVVRLGHKGLTIKNDGIASQTPLATAEAARKDKADEKAAAEEAAREEREAAEEAARKEREAAEEAARKEREAAEEAARKEREERAAREAAQKAAAEETARKESAAKVVLSRLIGDMIAIPGKNFKMGKYEVTQKQWGALMDYNPSTFKGDDNPVENVSWDDCKKFLEKLNARPEVKAAGLTFRLPTEKEWEYACRAGEKKKGKKKKDDFCWLADGTTITRKTLGKVAWYKDNSERKTHPVGRKVPNAFGLYDMHGNVYEWCEDLYEAGDSDRVSRGGSFNSDSEDCAAGNRGGYDPDDCNNNLGFRLAAFQDVNR